MDINIRNKIPVDVFDYQVLSEALKEYAYPRDKISDLLKKKVIIRVKKGLYIFGETLREKPVSRELLANLIYGPSCISLDYALHFHGLIPERYEAVTSICLGRSRRFSTPFGLFLYRSVPSAAYNMGIMRIEADQETIFLMASPEKSLADKIVAERGSPISSQKDMQAFLIQDLRIELNTIRNLDPLRIADFSFSYRSRKLRLLVDLIKRLKRHNPGASNE